MDSIEQRTFLEKARTLPISDAEVRKGWELLVHELELGHIVPGHISDMREALEAGQAWGLQEFLLLDEGRGRVQICQANVAVSCSRAALIAALRALSFHAHGLRGGDAK